MHSLTKQAVTSVYFECQVQDLLLHVCQKCHRQLTIDSSHILASKLDDN